jgi:signal peptidase I
MKNMKKIFEKYQAKFLYKKEKFKNTFARWDKRGWTQDARKGLLLLETTEKQMRELQEEFAVTAEGRPNDLAMRNRVKSFKQGYLDLYEMTKSTTRQWIEAVVVALVLAVILRNFVFGLYHGPTGSAEHTILVGERIWGNKMIYFFKKPSRGELVIFDDPEYPYDHANPLKYMWQRYVGFGLSLVGLDSGPDNWVKRVIAVPGDTVEGRLENGQTVIYVNGEKRDEPYVNQYPLIRVRRPVGFIPLETFGPFVVPEFLRFHYKESDYTYDPSVAPGDQVFYKLKEGEIVRNLFTGESFFAQPHSPSFDFRSMRCVDVFGPLQVPEGKYWVMGDSRKNSRDSRYWGFLDEKLIHGRASFIIYSIDSEEPFWLFDLLKHPIDFWIKKLRWGRFFSGLNKYNNWDGHEKK